jgi:hypothetical protein
MEMPLGDIGPGLVLLITGVLPVATIEDNFLQTNAGQVAASQHKDGNVLKFLAVHAHFYLFICCLVIW